MNAIKPGQILTGTVEKLAFGGKGIIHRDDFVVFVKNALPGQKISFQITKKKQQYAEAKLVEVLQNSPLEVPSEYEQMPGCPFQNIAYPEQLKIKASQVWEALEHIGGIALDSFEKLPIIPSPEIIRYRNKVEFSFGYERMRVETDARGKKIFYDENPSLGFHPEGKWAVVQPIADCFLISEKLNRIRAFVERFMKDSALPVWNPKIHRGFWRSLVLREGKNTGEIFINLVVSEARDEKFWEPLMTPLLQEIPEISGILETVHTGRSDFIDPASAAVRIMWGKDFLLEKLERTEFMISPFAFFQTNTLAAEKLFGVIRDFAGLSGTEKILDLFCGTGAIGLFLAQQARKIIGLEMDAAAVKDAQHNALHNNFQNTEYRTGKAEKELPELLAKHPHFDAVIVDPPRSGIHPKALEILAALPAQKMIFVSCNPATFARDLKSLSQEGWQLQKVQPVDMFPHTPHIEVVALLEQSAA